MELFQCPPKVFISKIPPHLSLSQIQPIGAKPQLQLIFDWSDVERFFFGGGAQKQLYGSFSYIGAHQDFQKPEFLKPELLLKEL